MIDTFCVVTEWVPKTIVILGFLSAATVAGFGVMLGTGSFGVGISTAGASVLLTLIVLFVC